MSRSFLPDTSPDAMTSIETARCRRPLHRQLAGATPLAIALSYGGGAWLQFLHAREGGVERNEPGFLAHWLRDSTLALPLVLLAVALAFWLVRGAVRRFAATPEPGLEGSLAAAGRRARRRLRVRRSATRSTRSCSTPTTAATSCRCVVHMLRDGALALPACLLIAAVTVGAARVLRRARAAEWWAAGGRVARYGLVFAVAAPAFVLSMQGAEQARALAGPGQPCPTDAPVKRFSVAAIDVDIPLNRFGDHDPNGKMYVLTEEIPAVRRQEASRKVSLGLRDDAIQPLVIRANLGDCVEIDYTNARDRRRVRRPHRRPRLQRRLLRRRRRPQRRLLRATRREAHLPLLRPRGQGARGHPLHQPGPRLPPGRRARPLRRHRRRAQGLRLPAPGHRACRCAPAGRR